MHVLVANLHEHAARLRQQFSRHGQPVAQVGEVRVDAQLPRITKRPHLLRLACGILRLAVLHIALARADLPVGAEFDAVGRVDVDALHLALQPFLLGQAGHHHERVAQDHAVGPVLFVLIELHHLAQVSNTVVVGKQVQLRFLHVLAQQIADDRLRLDLLLDVDRHNLHAQVFGVLFILALPHKLRVKRRIARVEHRLGRSLVIGHEPAQFLGGDVGALLLVLDGIDLSGGV